MTPDCPACGGQRPCSCLAPDSGHDLPRARDTIERQWLRARCVEPLDGEPAHVVAERHGVSLARLRARLRRGVPLRQAATETPVQATTRQRAATTLVVGKQQPNRGGGTAVAAVDLTALAAAQREGYAVVHGDTEERTADVLVALARARRLAAHGVACTVVRVADRATLLERAPAARGVRGTAA